MVQLADMRQMRHTLTLAKGGFCATALQTTLLGELRQLGEAISQDIFQESPNVKFSDIAGLADAKRCVFLSWPLPASCCTPTVVLLGHLALPV